MKTSFDKGMQGFTVLMIRFMLVMVLGLRISLFDFCNHAEYACSCQPWKEATQ